MDISNILYELGINPGWVAVFFGIVLFLMGRHWGVQQGVAHGAEEMIIILEQNKYLRVKRRTVREDGTEEVEYARYDE
jgi:hypothetical protein